MANRKVIRVGVVGPMHVGKTSMIHRIVEGDFSEFIQPTVGVHYRVHRRNGFEFEFYDTSGQEAYGSLIPSFVRKAHLVMMCYDETDPTSFLMAERMIDRYVSHFNVLLIRVAMRCDLHSEQDRLEHSDRGAFDERSGLRVSSKTGFGIDRLLDELTVQGELVWNHEQGIKLDDIETLALSKLESRPGESVPYTWSDYFATCTV